MVSTSFAVSKLRMKDNLSSVTFAQQLSYFSASPPHVANVCASSTSCPTVSSCQPIPPNSLIHFLQLSSQEVSAYPNSPANTTPHYSACTPTLQPQNTTQTSAPTHECTPPTLESPTGTTPGSKLFARPRCDSSMASHNPASRYYSPRRKGPAPQVPTHWT